MLETIIQRLLGRYLEPYVYNLSRENLRLGVLSGNLVLENLKLKENLGDIFHLPLSVVSGQIGHVSITIPWTSLGYKPLVIKLKEIHVVVKPKDYGHVDEEALRKELRESKEKLIEYKEKRLNERFLNGELSNSSNNPNEVNQSVGIQDSYNNLGMNVHDTSNGKINNGINNEINMSNLSSSKSNKRVSEDQNSANGTNLLWRIIKKIVANIQIEVHDIHICMEGFQSSDKNRDYLRNTRSDIIIGMMINSGFVLTTDSTGNKKQDNSGSKIQKEDPNALFKTVEINDVGVYIGQYFPNTLSYQIEKNLREKREDVNIRVGESSFSGFNMVNIANVRNKLLEPDESTNNLMTASGYNESDMISRKKFNNQTLDSKYLLIYDDKNNQKSLGAWRLEYILKPLTFHLNISHSPTSNEVKGVLQVSSVTEHTIILRRSHLRPIIFSLQSLSERQEKYREILMKNAHLVKLDPVSLKTCTQDEYISLYSRKLRLEAIRLYNSEGKETNFFGVQVQPLSNEESERLQILDDVLSVRHITKWRCKAKEAINRIIIEASSRKKLRNFSLEAKSLQMENGNLIINNGVASKIDNNPGNTTSWTKWAIGKIIGSGGSRSESSQGAGYKESSISSSPSYNMMHQKGICNQEDFTVSSNNSLITEEEMDVIMTAVTNEKYFEKIETPTKFSITFGLAYFGVTVFDDMTKPIIDDGSKLLSKFYNDLEMNDINANRNINSKFMKSIPNPSIDLIFLSLKLHQLHIQFNIQSVIDRNDKDCYDWNFLAYVNNLSLYHYKRKILFFDNDITKRAQSVQSRSNDNTFQNTSFDSSLNTSFGSNSHSTKEGAKMKDTHKQSNSIFLYFTHNVTSEGNSLKFMFKVSPLEIFITPLFVSDIYTLVNLYYSILIIPEKLANLGGNQLDSGFEGSTGTLKEEQSGTSIRPNYIRNIEDSDEFVENLMEKGDRVRYLSPNNSIPDYIQFDIEILSPIFHIVCNDLESFISKNIDERTGMETDDISKSVKGNDSISSIQIILGNCSINTKTLCELSELDLSIEFSNTQIKHLSYSKNKDKSKRSSKISKGEESEKNMNETKEIEGEYKSIIEDLELNKEFTVLHPVPILLNIVIRNQKKEEIKTEKDNLSIILKCTLQKFILTINSDTIKYLMHVPLSFYSFMSLPLVMGYYYLPPDTLKLSNKEKLHNKGQSRKLKQSLKDGIESKMKGSHSFEGGKSSYVKATQPRLTENVLMLMNKTMKIECYTKSDIFSFSILSEVGVTEILQGSIRGISSYISFNSTDSVYQGKISLHRALLYSSQTKKPLLLTISEFDPVVTEISEIYSNIDKKPVNLSGCERFQSHTSNGYDQQDSLPENDYVFVDAIEDYDSTFDVFFSLNNNFEENLLDISMISSPIEFYWDKPTILSLIDCLKSYQDGVNQIAQLYLQTLGKIYHLNRFHYLCIENNLVNDMEIISAYGNAFRLEDFEHYQKIKLLVDLREFLIQSGRDRDFVENNVLSPISSPILSPIGTQAQSQSLSNLISSMGDPNSWIHCIILMPPRFNHTQIQRVCLLLRDFGLKSSSHTVLSQALEGNSPAKSSPINRKFSNFDSTKDPNTVSENQVIQEKFLENKRPKEELLYSAMAKYYQDWMFSSLFNSEFEKSFNIKGSDLIVDNSELENHENDNGLPMFSFKILDSNDPNSSQTRKPKIRFTHIIKGGSLSMIKDEKIYITAGINNICICMDIFNTGDKAIKLSINNCSLTINDKCILSRHLSSSNPLLQMFINIYKTPEDIEALEVPPICNGHQLNIALKCYMDSLCYILYYKDVLEFVEYINDGILDTLISKSYKAAKYMTARKILLYYLNINNSIIKLPEDREIELDHFTQDNGRTFSNKVNPIDVFDETLQRYKDTLQDLLQELYLESKRQNVQNINNESEFEDDKSNICNNAINSKNIDFIGTLCDDVKIPNYILSRINNRESLVLLEKSISDYPRFQNILYQVKLFDKTQSYCEVNTSNIKIYNQLIKNSFFIKEFYEVKQSHNIEEINSDEENNIWITNLVINQGILDIIEKRGNERSGNGSEGINGRILPSLNAFVRFGSTSSFPEINIKRVHNTDNSIKIDDKNISLLNIQMSPLELSLSRQQLTFILNVLAENILYKGNGQNENNRKEEEIFQENDNQVIISKRRNILINIKFPELSLETSFSHVNFGEKGFKNTSLPLLLVRLFDCEIRSRILSVGDDENFTSITITSTNYQFDDIRLTSNLRFRRIIHGFTLGELFSQETLTLGSMDGYKYEKENIEITNVINQKLSGEKCSIQFICQISNKFGNQILLKAFNPRAFFGFNCIVDFYYYLSHSWRSSSFSRVNVHKDGKKDKNLMGSNDIYSENDIDNHQGYDIDTLEKVTKRKETNKKSDINRDNVLENTLRQTSESLNNKFYRKDKETIIQDFELLMKEISEKKSFKFEFKLEIEDGLFGFTCNPEREVQSGDFELDREEIFNNGNNMIMEKLILIWETNIKCSITTHNKDTIIKNLDLLNSLIYFTEILNDSSESTMNNEINIHYKGDTFVNQLLKPIINLNQEKFKPISFEIPKISQENKIVIANSFNITTSGKYFSNLRDIPEIYSTVISLSELIFTFNIDNLEISISPFLLSVLVEVAKKLFSDGPPISPLYTSSNTSNKLSDSLSFEKEYQNHEIETANMKFIQNGEYSQFTDFERSHDQQKYLTAHQDQGPPPIRRIYDLKISFKKFSLKFLNEDGDKVLKSLSYRKLLKSPFLQSPIINLEMSIPEWRIEIIPIKTNHTIKDANLKVSILDINHQIWEPVLEKCSFSIYYFYDHLILYDPYVKPLKRSHKKYFHSTFSETILINIKPSIIRTLLNFFNNYSESKQQKVNSAKSSNKSNKDVQKSHCEEITCKCSYMENYEKECDKMISSTNRGDLQSKSVIALKELSKPRSLPSIERNFPENDDDFSTSNDDQKSSLKFLNLTGLPYYCFTLIGEKQEKKETEFLLQDLFLLSPNNKIGLINFGYFQEQDQEKNKPSTTNSSIQYPKIPLKYINNCNSQIPLLKVVSLPSKLLCFLSAPIDKDVLRLKREFKSLDLEFIIRVLIVYKSYNLAQNILKYYRDLTNHDDVCNKILGPLPSGLHFTYFQDNVISSAPIDTIIPFHNLYYLKNIISKDSETYSRLFSNLDPETLKEIGKSDIQIPNSVRGNELEFEAKKEVEGERNLLFSSSNPIQSSLNKSFSRSISKSFSKASMKSIQIGIKKNLEKKFLKSGESSKNKSHSSIIKDMGYLYKNVIGQVLPLSSQDKLFCLISNHRIVNRTGIPLEICFLNENNIPIQLFDVSKISLNEEYTDLILNQEVKGFNSKYNELLVQNSKNCYIHSNNKLSEDSEYVKDDNLNYRDPKTIPVWLNNTDIVNTILNSMQTIYNSEDDISGIIESSIHDQTHNSEYLKQKRFYYSYFLPNNYTLSIPQIALLNNQCKVIFRPSIIGLFEMYNIHTQYNNDSDIDQMLFDQEIFQKYSKLMSRYNDENVLNDEFHNITYELLKIFKTSNGEFILDLYYTFWNNLISRFTNPSNLMDISYLQSRGWTHTPLITTKNLNVSQTHLCNLYSDFRNHKKTETYRENGIYLQSYIQTYQSNFPGNMQIKNILLYPSFSLFNLSPSILEIKVKSLSHNLLMRSSGLLFRLKPLHRYNIYQLSNEMKLQIKIRIMLESNYLDEFTLRQNSQQHLFTQWSSVLDLNHSDPETNFSLYCNNNNSSIDLKCSLLDKINNASNKQSQILKSKSSIFGAFQKNIIGFSLSTWFINKTNHNIVPIFENSPFPYINSKSESFYQNKTNFYNNFSNHSEKLSSNSNLHDKPISLPLTAPNKLLLASNLSLKSSNVMKNEKDSYSVLDTQMIFLLNNRHNYLKIYFNSADNLKNKYVNDFIKGVTHDIYLREEKEILEVINSTDVGKNDSYGNSNIGLLEIPPINGTYSFPIINEGKAYFFTVKSSLLFYFNDFSCSSKIITVSPHIIIENLTQDSFLWTSLMIPSNLDDSETQDAISKIDPNYYLNRFRKNKESTNNNNKEKLIKPFEKDFITSIMIDKFITNLSSPGGSGRISSKLPSATNIGVGASNYLSSTNNTPSISISGSGNSNGSDNNKNTIRDQSILLFLSGISTEDENYSTKHDFEENIRWSQPVIISSECNGIYYIPIPSINKNTTESGILINPKTYCIEVITSKGLFILKIMQDFSLVNKWDGVIFTNYCDYLSKIYIETYHFEHDLEEKKKRRRLSLLSNSAHFSSGLLGISKNPNDFSNFSDNITIRYIINSQQNNSFKISWSSPFLYGSRNCRLYIIPNLTDDQTPSRDYQDDSYSLGIPGILAFDMNFRYSQSNPYQSKRYILSLPESDILKLYAKKGNHLNNYPIATISITARNNGLYIDILPPRNHSSLLLDLLRNNNRLVSNQSIDERKKRLSLNLDDSIKGQFVEDIFQKRIHEINRLVNNDVWSLIYTYYRKVTLDISQIGISVISETRESEIIYLELSTIQFKKQEKNRNGMVETYKCVIGDIQIDNQCISSSSKFYINSSSKFYGLSKTDSQDIESYNSGAGISFFDQDANNNLEAEKSTNFSSSSGVPPYVLLANRFSSEVGRGESNEQGAPFLTVKWSCSGAKSQWETIIYNFDCELSEMELNFDFNVYKILNEFFEECRRSNLGGQYILDLVSTLSRDTNSENVEASMTFSIEKIKIEALSLFVWCSIPLVELNYIPEWFRVGLRILTVSNTLELRGAPIKLESHNLENSIGTIQNIANAFYEYYMAELLWRIGTVLGHSSFVNIPLVPLQVGKNTLNMAFSTISMVNSNITSLLSNLTLDSEYINSRQREIIYGGTTNANVSGLIPSTDFSKYENRHYGELGQSPTASTSNSGSSYHSSIVPVSSTTQNYNTSSLRQGFVQAKHNLTQGFLSLGSVITKPIEGAQKNGFTGFCTGLLKGVTSSVVRPIDHIGQALNNVIDGIQAEVNKPLGGYKQRVYRRRIPRMLYSHSSKIKDYILEDALLRDMIGPKFARHLNRYFVIPSDNYSMPFILLLFPKTIILIRLMSSFSIGDHILNNFSTSFGTGVGGSGVGGSGGSSSSLGGVPGGPGASSIAPGPGMGGGGGSSVSTLTSSQNFLYSGKSCYKSQLIWVVEIGLIREIKASSHGILIELSDENKDPLQIPVCKFSLIKEIIIALDNSQNNASPHMVFRK
ncbi:putative vacuolar protein sorting associated protein (VPS) [Cryptosporidium felis]|nr:putative vacuolar protein sorting associated protein (VPS) [Cryptosporidium felis]